MKLRNKKPDEKLLQELMRYRINCLQDDVRTLEKEIENLERRLKNNKELLIQTQYDLWNIEAKGEK